MSTVPRMLLDQVAQSQDRRCYTSFTGGAWRDFSWREMEAQARDFGLGLVDLGLQRGDVVAILGATSGEWAYCDLGALGVGGVTVGLYPTLAPEGTGSMHYVLDHSEARWLVVENLKTLRERIGPILGKLTRVGKIVLWDWDPAAAVLDPRCTSLADVSAIGRALHQRDPAAWRTACDAARPADLALLIYTSGTTGQPKGAMLSHGNVFALQEAMNGLIPWRADEETSLAFLPMAHVAERCVGHYGRVRQGISTTYARSLETLLEDFGRARPTIFGSVPRVFEKIYAKVKGDLAAAAGLKGLIGRAAFAHGMKAWRAKQRGERPGAITGLFAGIFEKKIAASLRQKLGGRCDTFISGAAPIAVEILEFLDACGFKTYEAYGLTETTGILTINHPASLRYGSVGKAIRGTELRIAEDGEITARSPCVFKGYFKDPQATKEAFTEDGFFKTGDIGALDADGFLKITDRKKNILITSGGKNITPSNIENEVKSEPLISYCHLHADRRPYPVALICVDAERLARFARERNLPGTTAAELKDNPAVREVVQAAIDRANQLFGQFERIRKFAILPKELSIDGGELTPTLKVKRKVVDTQYAAVLDALYADEPKASAA